MGKSSAEGPGCGVSSLVAWVLSFERPCGVGDTFSGKRGSVKLMKSLTHAIIGI